MISLFLIESSRQGAKGSLLYCGIFTLVSFIIGTGLTFILVWFPAYELNFLNPVNKGTRFQSYAQKTRINLVIFFVLIITSCLVYLSIFTPDHLNNYWQYVFLGSRIFPLTLILLRFFPPPKKSQDIRETNATEKVQSYYNFLGYSIFFTFVFFTAFTIYTLNFENQEVTIPYIQEVVLNLPEQFLAYVASLADFQTPTADYLCWKILYSDIAVVLVGFIVFLVLEGYTTSIPKYLILSLLFSPATSFCWFLTSREKDICGAIKK